MEAGALGGAAVELGAFVRVLRRRRGWRQIDLAVALSYSEPTISRIEAGTRALSTADADAIVRVLGLSAGEAVEFAGLVAAAALESVGVDGDVLLGGGDLVGFSRDLAGRGLSFRLGLRHGELLSLGESVVSLLDHRARLAGPAGRDLFEAAAMDLRLELAKAALEYHTRIDARRVAASLARGALPTGTVASQPLLKANMVREGVLYLADMHAEAVSLCRDLAELGAAVGGYWEVERARALLISTASSGAVVPEDRRRVLQLADESDEITDRVFLLEGLARAALAAERPAASGAVELLWVETERNLPQLMARAPARLAQVLRTIASCDDAVIAADHLVWRFVSEALTIDGNRRYATELVG